MVYGIGIMNDIASFHLGGEGDESCPYPEDVAHFRAHLSSMKPFLRQMVFDPRAGWRWANDLKNFEASFSLWAGNRIGFVLGMRGHSPRDFNIGVYCNRKADGLTLLALLDAHRHEILRYISWPREFSTADTPVYARIERSDPVHICRKLTAFRNILTPHLDRICPRRGAPRDRDRLSLVEGQE